MRIAYLTTGLAGTDGWGRYSQDLIHEMQRRGHLVLVLVWRQCAVAADQREVFGHPMRYLANPIASWLAARRVRPLLNRFQPEVIHVIAEPYATVLAFVNTAGAAVVMTLHGSFAYLPAALSSPMKRFVGRQLMWKIFAKADRVLPISAYTERTVLSQLPVQWRHRVQSKMIILPNAIDLRHFRPGPERKNDRQRILFVGHVSQRKGVLEALAVARRYCETVSENISFDIAGTTSRDNEYMIQVNKFIVGNDLQSAVTLHGSVSDEELLDLYQRADAFLMLPQSVRGKYEGFGLVYLEANACGVPVIGALNSGAESAIKDGFNGYLVDPADTDAAVQRLADILARQSIRRQDCIDWAAQHSIETLADRLETIYYQQAKAK